MRLHQIRYDVDLAPYDWTWNILAAVLIVIGGRAARARPPPRTSLSRAASCSRPGPASVSAVGYLAAAAAVNRRDGRWPAWRTASWFAGLACASAAVAGPLADAAHHDFTAHMAGHLLLGMAAPLLLVLAAPVTLALRALPTRPARALSRLLKSRPARLLTHPVTAATLNAGGLWALYATSLYQETAHHTWPHLLDARPRPRGGLSLHRRDHRCRPRPASAGTPRCVPPCSWLSWPHTASWPNTCTPTRRPASRRHKRKRAATHVLRRRRARSGSHRDLLLAVVRGHRSSGRPTIGRAAALVPRENRAELGMRPAEVETGGGELRCDGRNDVRRQCRRRCCGWDPSRC